MHSRPRCYHLLSYFIVVKFLGLIFGKLRVKDQHEVSFPTACEQNLRMNKAEQVAQGTHPSL